MKMPGTVSFFTLLSMAAEGVVEIESYIPQCDIPDYVKQHDYATEQMDYMIGTLIPDVCFFL